MKDDSLYLFRSVPTRGEIEAAMERGARIRSETLRAGLRLAGQAAGDALRSLQQRIGPRPGAGAPGLAPLWTCRPPTWRIARTRACLARQAWRPWS
ncbi:MAG TPA: hypothetical protein VK973_09945 [Arenicellales bacterium]|nr:hypothetical protein [Arenicellales bacterium]